MGRFYFGKRTVAQVEKVIETLPPKRLAIFKLRYMKA